jgi:hypothetical protein
MVTWTNKLIKESGLRFRQLSNFMGKSSKSPMSCVCITLASSSFWPKKNCPWDPWCSTCGPCPAHPYLHWPSIYITKSASSENNICGALFLNKSHIYYWWWLMRSSTVYYYWWGLYVYCWQTYINFFTWSKDENVRHLQCEFRMTHCPTLLRTSLCTACWLWLCCPAGSN